MIPPQEIIDFLKSQFLGIISLIGAVIIYKKQTKKKSPCYGIQSINIIENLDSKFENIEMCYLKNGVSSEKIRNLTVTKIIFWNEGKETIHLSDITTAKPLRIRIDDKYKILDAKIIYTTKEENLFKKVLSDDQLHVGLTFEYLDKNDGMVLQVIHTGKSNKDIFFEGTLKGCEIKKRYLEKTKKVAIKLDLPFMSREIKFDFKPVFLSLMIIFSIISAVNDYLTNKLIMSELYGLIITCVILVILIYIELKNRIPNGFEIFGEDI